MPPIAVPLLPKLQQQPAAVPECIPALALKPPTLTSSIPLQQQQQQASSPLQALSSEPVPAPTWPLLGGAAPDEPCMEASLRSCDSASSREGDCIVDSDVDVVLDLGPFQGEAGGLSDDSRRWCGDDVYMGQDIPWSDMQQWEAPWSCTRT
jgi:hypothetical protein